MNNRFLLPLLFYVKSLLVFILLCFHEIFINISGGAKSKMMANSVQHHQHKVRLARTISREPEVKESSVDDDDDDGQVSAV